MNFNNNNNNIQGGGVFSPENNYKSSNIPDVYKENFHNNKFEDGEYNSRNKSNTPNLNEYTLGCNNEENNENTNSISSNKMNNDFSTNENVGKRNDRKKNKSFKLKPDSFVNKFINSNK